MATARYRPDAFPKGPRTRKTPVRGNISPPCIQIQLILARYACYVSKNPAKRRWGIHRANILPPRGVFAVRNPQIMHGAQILPPSDGLGPCAGVPTPQRLANTRHLPMPATCQCLPLAVPVAARDEPPMDFGGGHPAHGLRFGRAPRGRRLRHLDGQADNGMLRRAGPGFQNREQAGAEPPAEAAGRAGPAAALPKTPIERTSPSWRNYRNTPLNETQKSPTSFNVFEGNRPNMQVRKRCLPLYSHLQRKGPACEFHRKRGPARWVGK